MRIDELNGKNICILGFGREGQAMAEALSTYSPDADVTIADSNEKIQDTRYPPSSVSDGLRRAGKIQMGPHYLKNLNRFDVVIKSPGIPPNSELAAQRSKLTSSTQIFLDTVHAKGSLVIGVTGSKGKSTTTSLIYEILKAAGKNVHLVGNIGIPSISFLNKASKDAVFVLEMSSYQLMDLTVSPHIAVVTSFFPEHLDYHGSLEAYWQAKANIARFQTADDFIFYNATSEKARGIAELGPGTKIGYNLKEAPITIDQTKLIGEHNLLNIAGAYTVARHFKVDHDAALKVIKHFKGLPHRLESLGIHHGIEWINDSISTTPESAIAAIKALGTKLQTIILGGQDRGYDFTRLIEEIGHSNMKHVITLPGSGETIANLLKAKKIAEVHQVNSMDEAVKIAKTVTTKDHTCVLSPASPSYGYFKNFEERGEVFNRFLQ